MSSPAGGWLAALRRQLRGELIQPGDRGYDAARSCENRRRDRHPAAVARCHGVADVIAAVSTARRLRLPVAVATGGRHLTGAARSDGGLVVDLSAMSAVQVDPTASLVRAQAGACWRDLDHETQAFGLATTGALDSRVGVAGHTLAGGSGHLARAHGLTADNLVAAELVTADGRLVRTHADAHPDLFWALRGGGGGCGVPISLEFSLHEVGPQIASVQAVYPLDQSPQVLPGYRDVMASMPDAVSCSVLIARLPQSSPVPAEQRGTLAVVLIGCFVGELEQGRRALASFERVGVPVLAAVQPLPYTTLQQSTDAGTPTPARYARASQFLPALSDEVIGDLVACLDTLPGEHSAVSIEPLGGVVARASVEATAWRHREAAYVVGIRGGWRDPADDAVVADWVQRTHAAVAGLRPPDGVPDDGDGTAPARGTGAATQHRARLREIRRRWDPEGLFAPTDGPARSRGHVRRGRPDPV